MVSTSTSALCAQHLRNQIYYHLDTESLDTASFLAGRLHALEPRNPESSHLLALTYFRLRRFRASYDFAHKYGANGRHLGCAYIFAQACLELGRHTDGTTALERARPQWQGKSSFNVYAEGRRRNVPDASAVWNLLGKLWQRYGDTKKAGECFAEAHKSNLFAWEAFESLCKVGADLNVEKMFKPTSEMLGGGGAAGGGTRQEGGQEGQVLVDQQHPLAVQSGFGNSRAMTPSNDPFAPLQAGQAGASYVLPKVKGKSALPNGPKSLASEWDTPTTFGGIYDEDVAMGGVVVDNESVQNHPPAAPSRKTRPGAPAEPGERQRQPALRSHPHTNSDTGTDHEGLAFPQRKPSVGGQKRTISGHPSQVSSITSNPDSASQPTRRSHRLVTQSTSSRPIRQPEAVAPVASTGDHTARPARVATGTRGRTGDVGRVVSGNRKMLPPNPTEKEKLKRAPSRNSEKSNTAPTVTSVMTDTKSQRPLSVQQNHPAVQTDLALQQQEQQQQALDEVCVNLRTLAMGSYALSRFDLSPAIQTFKSLPIAQRETSFVLAQTGKAHYEAANYVEAETCFAKLLRLQPSRIEDMEIYSTVLWHLKKDFALAALCHTLRESHFEAPQTWVSVGNAFSLAREHDQAISAFRRATQLDERFAYAWTLMGHEYIANEEFEAALSCFRKSVAVERRGYGGWYGLGKSFERMGKLEEAERHYRIASSLNSSNSTLLVCIGVVLERLHKRQPALTHYARALELAPQSALARFKKARVLMHLRFYEQALVDLELLRNQAPDEANVWFLLGKCYKGLGDRGSALRALTTALNLDVKAAPFIKEAMEALDEEDDESDED